jgi:hypothetical protein
MERWWPPYGGILTKLDCSSRTCQSPCCREGRRQDKAREPASLSVVTCLNRHEDNRVSGPLALLQVAYGSSSGYNVLQR